MSAGDDPAVLALTDDPVVQEARKRYDRCAEWEGNARGRYLDDIKFAIGDSDNGYQWPNAIRQSREVANRPCLTMNIIKQHNLQISNEARKNKSSVKIVGLGNGATVSSAEMFQSVIRRVEYVSRAQSAYTVARGWQIDGGIGWWRLTTDYADPDTFDQEIYIQPVNDPLSVFLDPDIQQKDGSDAKFGLVFDNIPWEQFEEEYPKFKRDSIGMSPLGIAGTDDDWVSRDHIRLCEYFRIVNKSDTLISFVHMNERKTIRKSMLPRNMWSILDDPMTRTRPVEEPTVEWKLIAGSKIIDETIWPGKYIPLVRVIGEETVVEGQLDRKGHTRGMKDAQRMYNYNASAQVEFVALQGKTPWVASAKAIEELESMWNTANTTNHSVLIYNDVDDDNPERVIAPPQRTQPPNAAPAYQQGMETAFNQMMMTSGQWQNQMGMMGNERTGAAIGKRQEQGDTATFHFQDNYEVALQYTGRQLIDLIPKVYTTKRVLAIHAEDGTSMDLELDPSAKQAFMQVQAVNGQTVRQIFNPNVGKYDVAATVGPAYGSKREQTVEALTLILTQAPALTGIIGDILLGAMDFDKAQEASQRLKRMVPPQALGTGPSPQEQQLEAKVQSLTMALGKALQEGGKEKLKLVGKDQMRDIDVYDSETKRLAALKEVLLADPEMVKQILSQLGNDALGTSLKPILDANSNDIDETPKAASPDEAPPMSGAKRAPDGEWYLADPSRVGKYLHIAPLAQDKKLGRSVISG